VTALEALAYLLTWLAYLAVAPVITLGLFIVYAGYRFVRHKGKGIIDQSAGFLGFLFAIWLMTTRTEEVAECMPFVAMDLSEMLRWRKDDGEIT